MGKHSKSRKEIKKENIPITLHQGNEIYLEKEG